MLENIKSTPVQVNSLMDSPNNKDLEAPAKHCTYLKKN